MKRLVLSLSVLFAGGVAAPASCPPGHHYWPGSDDVLPCLAEEDETDGGLFQTDGFADLDLSHPLQAKLADAANRRLCDLCGFVAFAEYDRRIAASALAAHVSVVVVCCAEPEVGWIYTKPVIAIGAVVKNPHTFRHGTEMNFPGNTVSVERVASFPAALYLAVARDSACGPQPAGFRFADFGPESFSQRFSLS